jgi:ribosome maturation factor RimP
MTEQEKIRSTIDKVVSNAGLFLVELEFNQGGNIQVYADNQEGISINECAETSRKIHAELGDLLDEYTLVVSSPGLDQPLRIPAQYEKNIGRMVDVVLLDGDRHKGKLTRVLDEGFEMEVEKKVKQEGKKKKTTVIEPHRFGFNEVKKTKIIISFK